MANTSVIEISDDNIVQPLVNDNFTIVLDDSKNESQDLNKSLDNELNENTFIKIIYNKRLNLDIQKEINDKIKRCLSKNRIDTDININSNQVNFTKTRKSKHKKDTLFEVDVQPSKNVECSKIPSYKRSIHKILDDQSENDETKEKLLKSANDCFNCGGDHSLRDCREPRNQQRINNARKNFKMKNGRYHVEIEQRFAQFKPGVISRKLKQAMGLRDQDIPSFTYKMRLLGYPPGWLEEAKVSYSGISLFDSEGREVRGSDDEDGQIDEKYKYDVEKIINYPGFNVDPGPDVPDEYKYFGVPPRSPQQSKDEFIKSLRGNVVTGYKRRKLKNLSASTEEEKNIDLSTTDMELEDNEGTEFHSNNQESLSSNIFPLNYIPPWVPFGTVPFTLPAPVSDGSTKDSTHIPPPPPHMEENFSTGSQNELSKHANIFENNIDSFCGSPNQEQIEVQPKALENSSIFNSSNMTDTEEIELKSLQNSKNDKSISNENNSIEIPYTPRKLEANAKSSVLGTPILKFSPFEKLPAGENFSKGVSDVINFENLPGSRGKYEQMKGVLKRIRNVITSLNEDN